MRNQLPVITCNHDFMKRLTFYCEVLCVSQVKLVYLAGFLCACLGSLLTYVNRLPFLYPSLIVYMAVLGGLDVVGKTPSSVSMWCTDTVQSSSLKSVQSCPDSGLGLVSADTVHACRHV